MLKESKREIHNYSDYFILFSGIILHQTMIVSNKSSSEIREKERNNMKCAPSRRKQNSNEAAQFGSVACTEHLCWFPLLIHWWNLETNCLHLVHMQYAWHWRTAQQHNTIEIKHIESTIFIKFIVKWWWKKRQKCYE